MPASRASMGDLKFRGWPSSLISPSSGMHGAADRLDQRRLARTVVADDGQDLVRVKIEVGVVEGGHAAIALDKPARGENGFLFCH